MNASEIFGIIIRCTGLALTLIGINHIYRAVILFVQVITITSLISLLYGVPALLIGIWFLHGAPQLMSFSYPNVQ